MDSDGPSLLSKVIAVAVLAIVVVIALRLVVGFVAGLVAAVFWIVLIVALVVAALWARSTLKGGRRTKDVKRSERQEVAPAGEDAVAAEMRKITEQLRDQGRG